MVSAMEILLIDFKNLNKEVKYMKKLIAKIAEAYAKSTTTSSMIWYFHATKAPRSLVK